MPPRVASAVPLPVVLLAVLSFVGAACGATRAGSEAASPGGAGGAPEPTALSIAGHTLSPRSVVLLSRPAADDAQLVLSDAEGLCAVLGEGRWPAGSAVLLLFLKHGRALQDAPFERGVYPLQAGGPPPDRGVERASYFVLDDACERTFEASARAGEVRLTGVAERGAVGVELDLSFGQEHVAGTFRAEACRQPEMEPRGCR